MKKIKLNRQNITCYAQDIIEWWLGWEGVIKSTRPYNCDDLIKLAKLTKKISDYKKWNSRDLYLYFNSVNVLVLSYCRWLRLPVIPCTQIFDLTK